MRKETTISSLKDQVDVLQRSIDEMSNVFLSFNDKALSSGVLQSSPELARELKSTTERFIALAKAASTDAEDDNGEDAVSPSEERDVPHRPDELAILSARSAVPPLALRRPKARTGITPAGAQGSSSSSDSTTSSRVCPLQTFFESLHQHANPPAQNVATLPFMNEQQHWRVELPPMPHPFSFSGLGSSVGTFGFSRLPPIHNPAMTLSTVEPTFGRRLLRSAFEAGYTLISNSHLAPRSFAHSFKLSLLFGTRDQMLERFSALMRNGMTESVEFWQVPYVAIGGAGTHYPERDAFGNVTPKPNMYTLEMVNWPRTGMARLVSMDEAVIAPDVLIDVSGYEGEWFDVYDVEGYFRERGLVIPPAAEFVDVDLASIPLTPIIPPPDPQMPLPDLAPDISGIESPTNLDDLAPISGSSNHSISPPYTPPQEAPFDLPQSEMGLNGIEDESLDKFIQSLAKDGYGIPDGSDAMSMQFPEQHMFSNADGYNDMFSGLGATTFLPGNNPIAVPATGVEKPTAAGQLMTRRRVTIDVAELIKGKN